MTDMNRPHLRFYFPCNNWLSKEDGDGLYVRDLIGSLNPMDVPKSKVFFKKNQTTWLLGALWERTGLLRDDLIT